MNYHLRDMASKCWLRECDEDMAVADRIAAIGAVVAVACFFLLIWVN